MSCQKTVIATAQGGALEMIDHQVSGIHIPLDNAQEAAKIIFPYLSDEKIRRTMGQVAQQKVNTDFSLASFEKNILQLLTAIYED
jgi:glycosyltransferase involved in cell wall biosynthesis